MNQQALSLGVVSIMVSEHPEAKERCIEAGVLDRLLESLRSPCPHVRRWACLCAGQLWEGSDKVKERALSHQLPQAVGTLLRDGMPEVRAAALYSLGTYMRVEKDGSAAFAAGGSVDFNGSNSRGSGNHSASGPAMGAGAGSDGLPPPGEGPMADGGDRRAGAGAGASGARDGMGLGASVEEGKARVDRELQLALAALSTLGDASPLVRRELVLLLGMLIRRFEESVVQVVLRSGVLRDGPGIPGREARGGGAAAAAASIGSTNVPIFFEEADGDWLSLYQAQSRGVDGYIEVAAAAARGGPSARSEHSSPSSQSSTMPIPASRRSPSKSQNRYRFLAEERGGSGSGGDHVPFPTEGTK